MRESRRWFGFFLLFLGAGAIVALALNGWSYYGTPLDVRPFSSGYEIFKPSGTYSHGLGIIGSLMIILGVATYSGRKRIRRLREAGKLSQWLQVHIFLCLLGPILVVYHSTFKVGGIAAITFWTMLSVVASGLVGRFLYALIPRNINGAGMSLDEIRQSLASTGDTLQLSPAGSAVIAEIDRSFESVRQPASVGEAISTFAQVRRLRKSLAARVESTLTGTSFRPDDLHRLRRMAARRAALIQKSLILKQTERLFFYWHVIHLPFTVIMFITLALHITAVVLLGYKWFF